MTGKRNGVLTLAGVLLLLAALVWGGYNRWDAHRAAASAEAVVHKLDARTPAPAPQPGTEKNSAPDPDREMPAVEIDGHSYIGVLDIPALKLSLPVMNAWSYPDLKLSPCRYAGSAYRDDLIIAAHNYPRHFGGLKELSAGDAVGFTDAEGTVFSYVVSEVGQLGRGDVEELESGDWALTLFTCTLGGSARVVVRCRAAEG